ncbi:MAG: hypothetical protein ACR2OO_09665 [Thermomicrobiales bacterium]
MAKLPSVTRGAALKVIAIAVLIAVVATGAPGSVGRALGQSGGGLEGNFTVTIAKEMIPKDVANGPLLIGRWRIAFNSGAYEVERLDIGNVVLGTFKVDGDKVTLTDKSGLLSCANASASTGDQGDVSSGSYTWTLDAGHLTLAVDEDKCALRRILLSSAELTSFVACLTAGGGSATPAEATPEADSALTRLLTPPASAEGAATPEAGAQGDVQAQIDGLLSQMSACWATGDPAKFLPLLSKGFQTQFLGDTKQAQTSAIQGLAAAMASPIIWERAGELGTTTDAKTSAVVRQTVGTTSTFVRFNFVFEDGAWRWDGSQA